jgi:ABC-type uncharacterized transport system ATPase component
MGVTMQTTSLKMHWQRRFKRVTSEMLTELKVELQQEVTNRLKYLSSLQQQALLETQSTIK